MKNKKTILPIRTKVLLLQGGVGFAMMLRSMLILLDPIKPIAMGANFIITFLMIGEIIAFILPSEVRDEMTRRHEQIASSETLFLIAVSVCILSIISIIRGSWMVDLYFGAPCLVGLTCLIYCYQFMKIDKRGTHE